MKLLVIDIQKGIVEEGIYLRDKFLENCKTLITEARKNDVEVIYIKHDRGANSNLTVGLTSFEIWDDIKPTKNEKVYIKTLNSCFSIKELKEYLLKENDKELIIIGLKTNFCIDSSIKSAFDLGFDVIIPYDSNSTTDNPYMTSENTYMYYNKMIWPNRFGKTMPISEVIRLMEK